MSFQYDLTAVEILKLLGYTEPVGKDALLQAEREKNLKLPPALFEFWSLAADCPLFRTADIWTKKGEFFWFSYDSIQEWIDSDKEYWKNPLRTIPATSITSFIGFPENNGKAVSRIIC